ncbi:MAG TPA: amino acid adenylation domain-containing protein, partial [Blastocatellia bacterium]|nr:amino acid adenylation domain-containing protein [Blastocatellia bacterium]
YQAARTPNAVAVTLEQEHLTYSELNARANRLARHLQKAGVRSDSIVGVYLERSVEMVVSLLAILKAGGAYLPLNPYDPKERIAFMLEDTRSEVLLTQRDLIGELPAHNCHPICVDQYLEAIARERDENLDVDTQPTNLAYVIYTSGSTGRPKGVMITHENVTRLFAATEPWFAFNGNDVWTMFHSYAFDFSVWEMWGAILYGGRLVVVPYWVSRSPASFLELVSEQKVTILNQTPSAFRQFILAEQNAREAPGLNLRAIIFGGEALELESLKPWIDRHTDLQPRLINMYGITETTVHVTYQPLTEGQIRNQYGSLIGHPIPDLQVYVLDRRLQPVPIGVPSEMYVCGDGLARGYLRRPDLTAERFVPHPFATEPGAKLYKTGDLARHRADGELEYLGRIDHQVKIRGFRIELGEIEAALSAHPAIDRAIVMAVDEDSGAKTLVSYLVVSGQPAPSIGELHNFLHEKLPDYMIPHAVVMLDALTLTSNGKVDRKALLAMGRASTDSGKSFIAPRMRNEKALAEIWSDVLGVERIGIHENFFELGGDSILSIQIVSRARQRGINLTPKHIFQRQTIAELAAIAEVWTESAAQSGAISGPIPLTPIQQWFFEQNLSQPEHYNQAVLLKTEPALDAALLRKVVGYLLALHDGLGRRFLREGEIWRQISAGAEEGQENLRAVDSVTQIDLSAMPEADQTTAIECLAAQTQSSLDLSHGPLVRVALFDLGIGRGARLLIVIHHLVVDGVAWRILLEDLQTGYEQLERGEQITLPAKTTSFKEWAENLKEYARSDELAEERRHWLADFGNPIHRAPANDNIAPQLFASSRTVSSMLSADETQSLLKNTSAVYHTRINDLMLTALVRAFRELWGIDALLVDLEGHGREDIFPGLDTSRTVGWFTVQFPALLDVSAASNPIEALRAVKQQLRAIPNHGIGYGLLRYMSGDEAIAESLRRRPQAEIRFNYLGQFDQLRGETGRFALAPESSGPAISPQAEMSHLLDISCRVVNARLEMSWRFSENSFARVTVEKLASLYLDELRELIRLCHGGDGLGYTTADFPLAKIDQTTLDALVAAYAPVEDIYPVSPLQQGLLFHTLQAPNTDMYFLHLSCRFEGQLDKEAFNRAWQEVVNRHTILRTAFVWEGPGAPLQIVQRRVESRCEELDWRSISAADRQSRLEAYLQTNRARGFDLTRAPLLRLTLFQLADNAYHFVWSSHHIVLDGWSYMIIIKEVLMFYDAISRGRELQLPSSRPYRDYIRWLQSQDLPAARAYWRQKLRGFTMPTPLCDSKAQHWSSGLSGSHQLQKLRLSQQETTALQAFARKHQLTLNTLVKGAWALFLTICDSNGGAGDVVFGSVVSGRPVDLTGAESMVGLLINTLPLRVYISTDTLLPWLRKIQEQE